MVAIIVPEQPNVDLSHGRGSAIIPRDTYVKPATPPPADTSIGDALNTLSKVARGIDQDKAEKDKAQADLYMSRVATALQGQDYNQAVVDGIVNPLHPSARALVQEKFGQYRGNQEAYSIMGDMPAEALTDPAAAAKWAEEVRAKALARAGNQPFFSNAFMQSVNSQIAQRLAKNNAERGEAMNTEIRRSLEIGATQAMQGATNGNYNVAYSPRPDDARAVYQMADRLGVNPVFLAAVIGYETAGSFSPDQWGGAGGRHLGVIQFGPEEQKTYGIKPGMTFQQQLQAAEKFLYDRGFRKGMTQEQLYATINAGNPHKLGASDAGNGGRPGDIRYKINTDFEAKGAWKAAAKFLGVHAGADPAQPAAPGAFKVVGDTGQLNGMSPDIRSKFDQLASAAGRNLTVTPHGGIRTNNPHSQHAHGTAMDISIRDMSDAEKTQLIAKAVANGAQGLGVYSHGSGVGTVHIDFRSGKGNGPGGLATWHRTAQGDKGAETAPSWYQEGLRLGLQMRQQGGPALVGQGTTGSPVSPASGAPRGPQTASLQAYGAFGPKPSDATVATDGTPTPPQRPTTTSDPATGAPDTTEQATPTQQVAQQQAQGPAGPQLQMHEMPGEALAMLNWFNQEDNKIARTLGNSPIHRKMLRDVAIRKFLEKAIETNDKRYLQSFPHHLLTADEQSTFRKTAEQIDERSRTAATRATHQTEEQRKAESRRWKIRIAESETGGSPLTKEEQMAIIQHDPDLMKNFGDYRKNMKLLKDPREDIRDLEKVKEEMEQAAAMGRDPRSVSADHIVDDERYKEAMKYADTVRKTGNELASKFYEDQWTQDQRNYYGYSLADQQVKPKPVMTLVNRYFRQALAEEVIDYTEKNGKPPAMNRDRELIYERTLNRVLRMHKPEAVKQREAIGDAPSSSTPIGQGESKPTDKPKAQHMDPNDPSRPAMTTDPNQNNQQQERIKQKMDTLFQ